MARDSVSELLNPDLIVVSPFIRTRQTAQPLIDLYPEIPVEEWPVQEFTYLDFACCVGMTAEQRAPLVREYWERNDPDHIDGESSESFAQFIDRVDLFLFRCRDVRGRLCGFSHTMFMQAVRMRMEQPAGKIGMELFRKACFSSPIRNLERLVVGRDGVCLAQQRRSRYEKRFDTET